VPVLSEDIIPWNRTSVSYPICTCQTVSAMGQGPKQATACSEATIFGGTGSTPHSDFGATEVDTNARD
jgi:hypothetical protein